MIIELTKLTSGRSVYVNVDNIVTVEKTRGGRTRVKLVEDKALTVKETPEQIQAMTQGVQGASKYKS